jgi:hypothetical protein
MSEHRTTVTATWPHTPKGTTIEVRVPDTYEISGVGYEINELVKELRKGTPFGRFVESVKALFRK